ncbi:hypothetical protein I6H88_09995 [Elizabethkingia bruuniana]|uniref:Bacteriocin n=1 Tax=Elizabethkingia bruuniana TaxID=1756149 RepID=A0A7T7V331_9FLAO|nr:hypothetical protein [Elizabethkingia bruuniana]KGO09318.1 hypothetical protein KS04_14840 [Elizabethkingia miricola]AQX87137.1 hypothetical protein AYC65_19980 [Elizabethkingia bruuniana]KUY23908.1 hypothetical protein ATB97_11065 [Elizabethkingia bruuniana]OPB61500.1 hypothetical protein BAY12_13555 [Elizabethkingia bruuniana]QDZ63768.1 hypothetical protein EVD20_16020 [Elizabethkingia bruuniana]
MKNLKKLSRTNLKEIHGGVIIGGGGSGIGGCEAHWIPGDQQPEPGMPYDCGCKGLRWCPGIGACVHSGQIPRSKCETGL